MKNIFAIAHRVKNPLTAIKIGLCPARNNGQGTVNRPNIAATYRRIHHANPFLRCLFCHILNRQRRNRTHIHNEIAFGCPGQNTLIAQNDLAHLGISRHNRNNNIRCLTHRL